MKLMIFNSMYDDFLYIFSMLISWTDDRVLYFSMSTIWCGESQYMIPAEDRMDRLNKGSDLILSDVFLLIIHQPSNILLHIDSRKVL